MALPRWCGRTVNAGHGYGARAAVPSGLLSTCPRDSLAYADPGSRDSLACATAVALAGPGSPMPFYQAPHRPTFASVLRSFAQDPDPALRQALPAAVVERLAAEEGVTFGQQANAVSTPAVTVWAFLSQCLSGSKSCVAAVARVLVLCVTLGRPPCAAGTAPYCKARAKLPEAFLRRLTYHVGERLEAAAESAWRWHHKHPNGYPD